MGNIDYDKLEVEWEGCLESFGINGGQLLQSRLYQRVYVIGENVYKVQHHRARQHTKLYRNLKDEFKFLQKCAGIKGVPQVMDFRESTSGQCLGYSRIAGLPLSPNRDPEPFLRGFALWSVVAQVGVRLWRISVRGVAHNDLRMHNILCSPDGDAYLLDFDLASLHSRIGAFYRNFFKLRKVEPDFYAGFPYLVGVALAQQLPRIVVRRVAGIFGYHPKRWSKNSQG